MLWRTPTVHRFGAKPREAVARREDEGRPGDHFRRAVLVRAVVEGESLGFLREEPGVRWSDAGDTEPDALWSHQVENAARFVSIEEAAEAVHPHLAAWREHRGGRWCEFWELRERKEPNGDWKVDRLRRLA
jgi:hypothetical protein